MRWFLCLLLTSLMGIETVHITSAQAYDSYFWETQVVRDIPASAVQRHIDELQEQVSMILDRGPLSSLRLNYSDQLDDAYWLYKERGRIITTLSFAYPYLTSDQQVRVRQYVRTSLADGSEAVWTTPLKAPGEGVERNLHGYMVLEGRFDFNLGSLSTYFHVLYGLWLYGYKTSDWQTVQQYWDQIVTFYQENKDNRILYGQLSGHIGMLRLAQQFGDYDMERTVIEDLTEELDTGLEISAVERRISSTKYARFYEDRNAYYFPGQPWMFLDATPEIWRYLNDRLQTEVSERITQFERFYPHWWLAQQPSFTRWTGDESTGLTSETFGMVFPYKRWIEGTSPEQLSRYMRSIPTGYGDSYWLEALVTTIEAYGSVCWVDVRTNQEVSCY